jgi:hypothetical protein
LRRVPEAGHADVAGRVHEVVVGLDDGEAAVLFVIEAVAAAF